jgi:alpha-glucosidase (family GH31 glycosyl hydrolase)
MLNQHLQVKTSSKAKIENIVLWKNYRITVLGARLIRMERSENLQFRDAATQSVWFRDMAVQAYQTEEKDGALYIQTDACTLKICENRDDCRIRLSNGEWQEISNAGNLLGTYRTLDECNGNVHMLWKEKRQEKVQLGTGVCSKTGVAVYDDAQSLTLGDDGTIKAERGDGTDEYIFAFGNDYRAALRALYAIAGKTPLVPRFALGNWWSRYHAYTQEEYMQLLTRFKENDVPLSVATIDMDWHWSTTTVEKFRLKETGKNTPYYVGEDEYKRAGWTGYSWNTDLFPDYRAMLKEIEEMGLKITLNLHPADGVRFWDEQYGDMCKALGMDSASEQAIPFDITDDTFVNAYFDILHKPFEREGVAFWWIDWQQGTKTKMAGLDPLWSLNHYHYLDNAKEKENPLILSRYAGVGSHRYPLGFSGDTEITWATLDYLPYFTATASNVGYTWWSHDIGGHHRGEKEDELFVRHVQFGVLSPINRLHCSNWETLSKEPWYFLNGAGEIVKEWLRLRHKLLPYLYSASYRTHENGLALIEPLYYEWDLPKAYEYDREYLFGGQMLVVPVTAKRETDGYARVKAWIPEGVWTDIFTGDRYVVEKGGVEKTLLRTLDSVPVLVRAGGIIPLGANAGNDVSNPKKLEICVWEGDGAFTLSEDGREQGTSGVLRTQMTTSLTKSGEKNVQTLRMQFTGNASIVPMDRVLRVSFKDIPVGACVRVYADGVELPVKNLHLMHAAAEFAFNGAKEIVVTAQYEPQTELSKLLARAAKILTMGEYNNRLKIELWVQLEKVKTVEEYAVMVATCGMSEIIKTRLTETL